MGKQQNPVRNPICTEHIEYQNQLSALCHHIFFPGNVPVQHKDLQHKRQNEKGAFLITPHFRPVYVPSHLPQSHVYIRWTNKCSRVFAMQGVGQSRHKSARSSLSLPPARSSTRPSLMRSSRYITCRMIRCQTQMSGTREPEVS